MKIDATVPIWRLFQILVALRPPKQCVDGRSGLAAVIGQTILALRHHSLSLWTPPLSPMGGLNMHLLYENPNVLRGPFKKTRIQIVAFHLTMYGIAKALNGALREAFLPTLDSALLGLRVAVVLIFVLSHTAARQNTSRSELVSWPSNVAKPRQLYSSCLKQSRSNFDSVVSYKNATADPRRIWDPSDFEKTSYVEKA